MSGDNRPENSKFVKMTDYWWLSTVPAPAPAPPVDRSWDLIVGVPLDVWMACRTTAELQDACAARDRGVYADHPDYRPEWRP